MISAIKEVSKHTESSQCHWSSGKCMIKVTMVPPEQTGTTQVTKTNSECW